MRTLGYQPSLQASSDGEGKVLDSLSVLERGYSQIELPWAGECRK